jgi:hypothetical protein
VQSRPFIAYGRKGNPMSTDFSAAPYPGLRSFRADESDIYFGREVQTDALLDKLARTRLLAVVGPSGCGKSSLVRAGMIAALHTGFMAAAGAQWQVAEMRPGDRPMARLADALRASVVPADQAEAPQTPLLEAALRRGPLGLVEVVSGAGLPAGCNLLLLVDQFEEIFRYRQKVDSDEADAFVSLLLASAAQRELPLYVVITMRSDFLGDCALFNGLPEAINDSQYLTPRLTREQCRLAITGPARVFGGEVEAGLVNRLLNDFGPDPDQLPLLQHALMRMWDRARARAAGAAPRITLEDYEQTGGLARALSDHADEVMGELAPAQRTIAEVMFRRLTERGMGRRDTRAPARLSDVAAVAGVGAEAVYPVVEAFRRPDRSFVTPPAGLPLRPDTLLDIGHESLIRQWRALGDWVEREARSAALYQRLSQTAQLWRRGEAALWRNPDLERALKWQQEERPSAAWAARYGPAQEFEQATDFLRESERTWNEEHARAEQAAQRERDQAIALQTQAAAQEKLRAENAALRSHRRFLVALAVLLPLLAVVAGWAAWQMKVAREEATAADDARRDAEEQAEKAALASARAQREAQRATALLERLTNSEAMKRAFLTEDAEAIRRYAAQTPKAVASPPERTGGVPSVGPAPAPARSPIRWSAGMRALGWKTGDGKQVYRFDLCPAHESLRGGLRAATQVSYFMDHPSFARKLIVAGPANGFTGFYDGWGCLSKVYVLLEYADPERLPEVHSFDQCARVNENPRGCE